MVKLIREVSLQQVHIPNGFWSKPQEKIVDIVLPSQEKVLNDQMPNALERHASKNFRIAAGMSRGEFYGMVFQDSDAAKWLEGVAYALAVKPEHRWRNLRECHELYCAGHLMEAAVACYQTTGKDACI